MSEAIPAGREQDKALVVVRCIDEKLSDYRLDAARRKDGEAEIKLSKSFRGKEVACYLVFVKQKALLGIINEEWIG